MKKIITVVLVLFLTISLKAQETNTTYKFDFGSGKVKQGYLKVSPESIYSKGRGWGFLNSGSLTSLDRGGKDPLTSEPVTTQVM